MPRRRTGPARYSGIRNRWPVRTRAGKPDSPGRRSGPPPVRLLTPSRSPGSPKPHYASVPPWRLPAASRLQFRFGVKVGIFRASGVPAGGRRLALLEAGKAAVAAAGGEITALDAEREIPRSGGQRRWHAGGTSD